MKPIRIASLLVLAATLLWLCPPAADAQTHGGTGILKIKPCARATGMGQAGVALPQRGQSVWWNPALLAQAHSREVSTTVVKLVPDLADDVYYLNLAYSQSLGDVGGIGFDLMYLSYGKTEAVDEEGTSYGFFSSYEAVPTVAFGTRLIGDPMAPWGSGGLLGALDIGVALKFVWVDLAPEWAMSIVGVEKDGQADAWAVDLGTLVQGTLPFPSLSGDPLPYALGVNVQNLGSKLVYIEADQGDPLPHNLKAGLALEFYSSNALRATGVFDFNKALIDYESPEVDIETAPKLGWGAMEQLLNAGVELSIQERLHFRVGYVHDPEGEIESLTFGAGLDVAFGRGRMVRFDYSSVPQALDLDRVSYLTVGVLFDEDSEAGTMP